MPFSHAIIMLVVTQGNSMFSLTSILAEVTIILTSTPGGGGGTPHMKGVGMLFVSRRGVNLGFWSDLRCSGQNAIIFRLGLHLKKYKKIHIVCVLTWSLLGVKKTWATPRSVSLRSLIQNFRRASPPRSYADSPPGIDA